MKKNYLKLLASAFILTVGVTACGSSDSESGAGAGGEGDAVTVEFFNQKPEITSQLEQLAGTYQEENPNVNVTITTVGSGQGPAGLQAKFASGDEPAIMMLGGLPEVERYQDSLVDVSDMAAVEDVVEGQLQGGTIDGTPLGIPMSVEGVAWMYNRDIFEQAGIDPASIQTYDDFVSAVETLDSQKEELGIDAVFAYSGSEDWVANQFSSHFVAPEYNNDMIEMYNSSELNWEYGNRMQMYTDLVNQYTVQPILTMDYSTSVEDLFINGQVAMIHQGNWIIPTLNGLNPEFVENQLGILPVFGESDTEGRVVVGVPWFLSINKNLDESVVNASQDFLNWMYTSEEAKTSLVEDFDFIPAHEGFDVEALDPTSQEIYQALVNGETNMMAHKQYPNGYFQESLFPAFQRYLNGDISWDEFESTTSQAFSEMQ